MIEEFVLKSETLINMGWGNGYVIISEDEELYNIIVDKYEMNYDNIPVNIHGGITLCDKYSNLRYSLKNTINKIVKLNENKEYVIIGFDTYHLYDNEITWPKHAVIKEAKLLRELLKLL